MGRLPRLAAAAVLLPLATGCYSYVPLQSGAPEQGDAVVLHLAAPADVRLGDVTANDVTRVRGEVITWDADTLAVSAFRLRTRGGRELAAVGETVRLPRAALAAAEVRRLSLLRSAGLFGTVILAGVLTNAIFEGGGGGGDLNGGVEPK